MTLRIPARLQRISIVLLGIFCMTIVATAPSKAVAAPAPPACVDGPQSSGAIYRICMPANWNGDLVLYAHGFVDPHLPVAIPEDQLELNDVNLIEVTTALGFAFGMSSYSKNGLAILQGIDDTRDVVDIFTSLHGAPDRIYLFGASEGGLVTALSVERMPQVYDGGIAACGPVGDFPAQINYFGDARILFDYFYPGLIPGTATSVPDSVIADWETVYEPRVIAALLADTDKMEEYISVLHMPYQAGGAETNAKTIAGLVWYAVHSTADAMQVLGGQMFDNANRRYIGSKNDARLNDTVARYTAAPAARDAMRDYQTAGGLRVPLITIHTTGDPIVPYWHEIVYKVRAPFHLNTPVGASGHCNFSLRDALGAFLRLRFLAP